MLGLEPSRSFLIKTTAGCGAGNIEKWEMSPGKRVTRFLWSRPGSSPDPASQFFRKICRQKRQGYTTHPK